MEHGVLPRCAAACSVTLLIGVMACSPGEGTANDDIEVAGTDATASVKQPYVGFGSCESQLANSGFWNDFYPVQEANVFNIDFNFGARTVDGADGPVDAVLGLANGTADSFTDLGPIVRFNPSGFVDARNGARYEAVNPLAYHTGWQFYAAHMVVDLQTHRYSASVNEHGFPEVEIARDFAFRTEQQAVPKLDAIARIIETPGATLQLCDVQVRPSICRRSTQASGWSSTAYVPQSGQLSVEFDVTPLSIRADAVIGVSLGAPRAFRNIAAAFRFNPDGYIDARNGSTYAAETQVAYQIGQPVHVIMDIAVAQHRYWVTLGRPGYQRQIIASNYSFRTEQAGVTALDHVGQIVDDPEGEVQVCDVVWAY